MRPWLAILIGVVFATIVGTALVAGVTLPLFAGQEWGIVCVAMYLLCFWGCSPALILPFAWMAAIRRTTPKRVILASLAAGALFPIFIAALLYLLPWFDFDELDIDDLSFWCTLLPCALAAGFVISHFVLGKKKKEKA